MADAIGWEEAMAKRTALALERERVSSTMGELDRAINLLDRDMINALQAAHAALPPESKAPPAPGTVVQVPQRWASPSEYILWAIQQPVDFDIAQAASDYYGANSPENHKKVSRELWNLQQAGKIRKVGPDRYEVVK